MTISEIRGLYNKTVAGEEILSAYRETELEEVDHAGNTLLHIACSMADADAVALLLEKGLSATVRNQKGQSPLYALAALDDRCRAFAEEKVRRCADLLFDANANVIRKEEEDGDTPITKAGREGRYELLQSAVAHGVKLTVSTRDGSSALHLACEYVRHEISDLGYACDDEDKANAERRIEQYVKSVEALLAGGMEPGDKNDQELSAIDIAIQSKAGKIAVLLQGGDPNDSVQIRTGGMTLAQAVIHNVLDAVRANVELGADINGIVDEGDFKEMTPLAIACYTFNLAAVELLLALGADPDFKDANGMTALARWFMYLGDFHLNGKKARERIPAQILKALIKSGMDKNAAINDKGDTPLLGACACANQGRGYSDTPRLGYAIAQALIAAHCDPNRSNLKGVTPIMPLCAEEGENIANLLADLLEAGAELGAVDQNGNTPLHYAAQNGAANTAKELAELLFNYGFEHTDAVNNEGKSALEIASENNNEPLVQLILMNS